MKHPSEDKLSALVDGMLTVAETQDVAGHLAQCEDCRRTHASFEALKMALKSAPAPTQPADAFWSDTYRRMRVEVGTDAPRRSWTSVYGRQISAGLALLSVAGAVALSPIAQRTQPMNAAVAPAPQDTLDAADFSSFVRVHTNSAAAQPLADRDRQQLISADINASFADDPGYDVASNGEISL